MPEVVIGRCHGGWSPKDGYAKVPAGTTLYVFVDPMRSMDAEDADNAILGDASHVVALQGRARETITEYRTICNYSTSDLGDDDLVIQGPIAQGIELIQGGWTLQQVLDTYPGSNIYWFACQVNVLYEPGPDDEHAGGEDLGAYQIQRMDPDDRAEGWKIDPDNGSQYRWWNGSNWTEDVSAGQG